MLSTPTATLVEPYAVIWEHDPALDRDCDEFVELYTRSIETGRIDDLPLKPGQKPTIFYLRHPDGELADILRDLASKHGPHMASAMAVAYCLERVEGWGAKAPAWFGARDERGHRMVPTETMDVLRKFDGLLLSLASVIWRNLVPSKN